MASYLLLRSNKKTGPYSIEELIALKLKAYDLIWVEGKSAAWRYPSEIDELKDFAPAVEEQPYDRFYKKGNQEQHFFEKVNSSNQVLRENVQVADNNVATVVNSEKKSISTPPAPVTEERVQPAASYQTNPNPTKNNPNETVQPRKGKKVFVSMPTDKHLAKVIDLSTKTEIIQPASETVEIPKPKEYGSPAPPIVDDKSELKQEYSKPLDEIKQMYIETYLQKKQPVRRDFRVTRILPYAGAAIFVIVLGTLIYLTIKSGNNIEKPTYIADKSQTGGEAENSSTDQSQYVIHQQHEQPSTFDESSVKLDDEPEADKKKIPATRKSQENILVSDPNDEDKREPISQPTDSEEEVIEKNAFKPIDFRKYVSISSNDYKRKAFGGIHDLQLTVSNDTKYILDRVMVQIQYLKPSEEPLKTETYQFSSVPPNGSMTIRVPDSPRGIKVAYKITQIESNQYDKDLANL